MATIRSFEDILAWQKARTLCKKVGEYIDSGRVQKNYRLIGRIEGSAGSIMDNIVEGFERGGNKEFLQFLYIAKGSCGEFRSQLYRALDRNYFTKEVFDELYGMAKEIIIMLQKLIDYLQHTDIKGVKFKVSDPLNS